MAEYHNHSETEIQNILQTIIDPFTGIALFENNALESLTIDNGIIGVSLTKSYPVGRAKGTIENLICDVLSKKLSLSINVFYFTPI